MTIGFLLNGPRNGRRTAPPRSRARYRCATPEWSNLARSNPAHSESQRRLFGMALAHKRGKLSLRRLRKGGQAIRRLSKLPLKTLRDYARKPIAKGRRRGKRKNADPARKKLIAAAHSRLQKRKAKKARRKGKFGKVSKMQDIIRKLYQENPWKKRGRPAKRKEQRMARRKGRKNPRFGKKPKTWRGLVRRFGVKKAAKARRALVRAGRWKDGKIVRGRATRKNPSRKRRHRKNAWKGASRRHAKAARKGWARRRRKAHRKNPSRRRRSSRRRRGATRRNPSRKRRRSGSRRRSHRRNPSHRRRGGRRRGHRRNPDFSMSGITSMLKSLIPSMDDAVAATSLAGSMLAVELLSVPAFEKIGAREYIQKLGLPTGLGEQALFTAGATLLCGFMPWGWSRQACRYTFLGGLTAIVKGLMVNQIILAGKAGEDAKSYALAAGYKPLADYVTFKDYVTLKGDASEDAYGALECDDTFSVEPGEDGAELADYYGVTAF